ncbi:MAG: TM2 domain-containing protein [Actinobacteria bacterium]|nr:TM2 domain-containing protein [Actinomycetota bacterium]
MALTEADKKKIEEEEQYRAKLRSSLSQGVEIRTVRSRAVAGILALLLGGIGAHKFYLGKIGQGFLYLLFFWTSIPMFIGIIEGLIYLTMSDKEFEAKYH